MSEVIIGNTLRITVGFRSWSSGSAIGVAEDPETVVVTITNLDDNTSETVDYENPEVGTYYTDWTPTEIGSFEVEFVGSFSDDSVDTVTQVFDVVEDLTTSGDPLLAEYEMIFAAGLNPLYVSPEELTAIFTDAPLTTVAEEIFIASNEVKKILGLADDVTEDNIPLIAMEYVRAAVACKLSKIYEVDDPAVVQNFRLGDLQVMTQPTNKARINRGNASTWCELAYALRNEMLYGATGIKAVVKSSAHPNPIPVRRLRSL